MKKFLSFLDKLEEVMIFGSFLAMALTVLTQIVTRVFFSTALIFTEELARYCYIWLAFSGMSWLYRNNANISLEIVTQHLTGKKKYIFNIITNVVTFVVMIILLKWCPAFLKFQSTNKSPAMHANMAFVYGILPFAFVMTCIRLIQLTVDDIKSLKSIK